MKNHEYAWRRILGAAALAALLVLPSSLIPALAQEPVTIDLAAENNAFDKDEITVPAGAEVTVNFENRDQGIPHNFAVYVSSDADEEIFVGEIIDGVQSITYNFTAPEEPGTYFFRCDVHPFMSGDFIVTGETAAPTETSPTEMTPTDTTATTTEMTPTETTTTTEMQEPMHFSLVQGWYKGVTVRYYDFGASTPLENDAPLTAPIYAFITEINEDGEPQFVEGQHNVVGVVPGDEGYSDLWQVNLVYVPMGYVADTIRSVPDVLESGYEIQATDLYVNCPIVPEGSTLENDMELVQGWYDGDEIYYFDFGPNPVTWAVIYAFITGMDDEGNPEFVEGQRNIIDVIPGDEGYTAFWRVHLVQVPPAYEPDTIKSFAEVLDSGYVITSTDILVNCPVHDAETPVPTETATATQTQMPSPTDTTTMTPTPTETTMSPTQTTGTTETTTVAPTPATPTQTTETTKTAEPTTTTLTQTTKTTETTEPPASPTPTHTARPTETTAPPVSPTPTETTPTHTPSPTVTPTPTETVVPPGMPLHFDLVPGWYRGMEVRYYDFEDLVPYVNGQVVSAPIWVPVYGMDEEGVPQIVPDQMNIIDVIPGDEGYSDLWRVNLVVVPPEYQANNLTSAEQVMNSGYPVMTIDLYVNCPVVPEGSTLETGLELTPGWYRGETIYYFDFGVNPPSVAPIYIPVYGMNENGEPQTVEGQRNIIDVVPGQEGYTDLWLVHYVIVPQDYTANTLKSFDQVMNSGYETRVTDIVVNCPVYDFDVEAVPPEVTANEQGWPLPNKDYSNTRAAMNSSIDSSNVADLGIAWAFPLTASSTFGAAATNPIIMEDMVFFQDLQNNVYALDRMDGSLVWEAEFNIPNIGPNGVAVGWGKVFAGASISEIVALDMNTGEELWRQALPTVGSEGIDIQPQLYGGLVLVSTVPGNSPQNFYAGGAVGTLYALNRQTGNIEWSFDTVDSADIWGNPEVNSGGGAWYPPAVDTGTGITYWSVANPAPWPGTEEFPNGTSRPGPNLYTNTLVALNGEDGALQWYNQVLPHDVLDYDLQISPVLAGVMTDGAMQDIVITAGKMGRVYAMDRETGELLWETPVGLHENDEMTEFPTDGSSVTVLPGIFGGVETPIAYADGVVYVPVVNLAVEATGSSAQPVSFDQGTGELVAISASDGSILWSVEYGTMNFGGATVVNDLVFTATFDGMVYAYDRMSGEEVFSWQAPAGINGWPAVAGDMIIWPAGQGAAPSLVALAVSAETQPILDIVQPAEGEVLQSGNVTVSVQVLNFDLVQKLGEEAVPGEGHLHFYMDVEPPTVPGEPAVTEDGTYMVTTETSVTWESVPAGEHTFYAQLVNNDHTPLDTPVVAGVTVMVSDAWVTITQPSPQALQPFTENSINVEVEVSNFTLGEGEGRIIYYLDTEPPVMGGGPAVTGQGTYRISTETSMTWENLSEGLHVFYVQLVDSNNMPLDIPVIARTLAVVSQMGQQTGP